jgi:hypothetical protein
MKPGDYVYYLINRCHKIDNRFGNTIEVSKEKIIGVEKYRLETMDKNGEWKKHGEEIKVRLESYDNCDPWDYSPVERFASLGSSHFLTEEEALVAAEKRQKDLNKEHMDSHPNCTVSPCKYSWNRSLNIFYRSDSGITYVPIPCPGNIVSDENIRRRIKNKKVVEEKP